MGVGTRWWRREEIETGTEVWGGPGEVTLAPTPVSTHEDRVARDEAEREARELAEREAREQAERQAREEAEREAREQAERAAREQAEREAREQAERRAREQAEREAREQAEREAREQAEREARERAEQDRVSTLPEAETVSPAAREAAAREAAAVDRKRRRRRVLVIFGIAAGAVAVVWIVPRLIALALALLTSLAGTMGVGPRAVAEAPAAPASAPGAGAASPIRRAELPRGGMTIAPAQRVVVLRDAPTAPAEAGADRLESVATPFGTTDRSVLPALELPVGGVADTARVWQHLAVTRAHRQLLVLAVPTGPADVRDALVPWERILREPDVGLALDPAAPLAPEELADVTGWLAGIVRTANLPQKLLVVPSAPGPAPPPELAVVATDRAGPPPVLRGVVVAPGAEPRDVLAATPSPDVVLYRGEP